MRVLVICIALLPLACGGDKPKPPTTTTPSAGLDQFKLAADPGKAISVNETKQKGPGEEVIVVGRLNNIVKGLAAFNLVDESMEYCGQATGEKCCNKPWDYC
jgi:hypothetical protein